MKLSDINSKNIKKGMNYIKNTGLDGLVSQVKYKMSGPGLAYNGWYSGKHEADSEELARQRDYMFEYSPLISIVVPVYMTPEFYLRALIESILKQTYIKWELIIIDGSQATLSDDESAEAGDVFDKVYSIETERIIKQYSEDEPRIKYVLMEENLGISDNTNLAIELAQGEYITLVNHDDMLTEDALFCIVDALQELKHDIIYTDEDKMSDDGTKFSDPTFKPDFSIDLSRSYNYIRHFITFKKSIAVRMGGFVKDYDGGHIYDFLLRFSEQTWDFHHISRILYHYRICNRNKDVSVHKKEYTYSIEKKALSEHIVRLGLFATVSDIDVPGMYKVLYETPGNPFISIVISGGSNVEILDKCVKPLFEKARYYNFEIIIVDTETDNVEKNKYYKTLGNTRHNVKVVYAPVDSSVSEVRNFGAASVKGEYILFLDSCVELIATTSIGEMLGLCMRKEVGLVGATLYSENSSIYSSCYAVGLNRIADHLYKGVKSNGKGYLAHNRVNCDYSAVQTECMMIETKLFVEIGGFEKEFRSELADIDICLKVRENNKLVVCAADASWYYHRLNMGKDSMKVKFEPVSDKEENFFGVLWSNLIAEGDPYYNSNFKREGAPFSL